MRANDALRLRGELRLIQIPGDAFVGKDPCRPIDPVAVRELCRCGRARERVLANMVTDSGLSVISRLIGFGRNFPAAGGHGVTSVDDLAFSYMRLGTTLNPPAVLATDIDISESPPSYQIDALTVFYPGDTTVTIAGVVPQAVSALDGFAFTEEGLFVENTAMLAHVVFSPEVKLPTHAIQIEHTFSVSRV